MNGKFHIILAFVKFLGVRRKYWLIPIVVMLLVLSILFVVAQGSVVAPLIYPLF
ncbi:MAG: DUF5989 family protein [Patescibacteria group bacterium]